MTKDTKAHQGSGSIKAPRGNCSVCPLINGTFVPSEINDSHIMVLAEAPGFHEAQEGKPLVGMAGQDLDQIIQEVGSDRRHFNLVNAVSCRPTRVSNGRLINRTPTDEEIKCCNDRMAYEIEKYDPTIIIAMGKIPYVALGGHTFGGFRMADVVGTEFLYNDHRVIVTYHPAAIGHSGGVSTERGKMTRDDIVRAFTKALGAKPADVQLKMFE